MATVKPKKVFISYVWEDEAHKIWVRKLADTLRNEHHLDVILDQYELSVGKNMTHFMTSSLAIADKVLVVLSPKYKSKAIKGTGGGGFESSIISQELFLRQTSNDKFLPVLRRGTHHKSAPGYLETLIYHDMRNDDRYEADVFELGRLIHEENKIVKPAIGPMPDYSAGTGIDPVLAVARKLREREDAGQNKLRFLNSNEGVGATTREIESLFNGLKAKAKEYYQQTTFFFRAEAVYAYGRAAIWGDEGCGIYLLWQPYTQSSTREASLVVKYYDKFNVHFENDTFYENNSPSHPINRVEYRVDVASDLRTILWRINEQEQGLSSDELMQELFLWLINQIVAIKDKKMSDMINDRR